MGQHKGKDYYFSEKDNKYLFSYFTYWGFSEVLGQPTFYYYAKSEDQCPDNVSFLYYSWKTQGSAKTKARCIDNAQPMEESAGNQFANNIFSQMPPATTTKRTTTTRRTTTTTTRADHCEISDMRPVTGGAWRCTGSRCAATCDGENFRPVCTESSTLMCVGGRWNFPHTECNCERPVGKCGKLQALKGIWMKRNADYVCSSDNQDRFQTSREYHC